MDKYSVLDVSKALNVSRQTVYNKLPKLDERFKVNVDGVLYLTPEGLEEIQRITGRKIEPIDNDKSNECQNIEIDLQRIENIESEIDSVKDGVNGVSSSVNDVESRLTVMEESLKAKNEEIESLKEAVKDLTDRLNKQQEEVSNRLLTIVENQQKLQAMQLQQQPMVIEDQAAKKQGWFARLFG